MEMTFGSHVVVIDADATRAYYIEHPELRIQDQAHRNYACWLASLSGGELAHFQSIGIDDHTQCSMPRCYVNDDDQISIIVAYAVPGTTIKQPDCPHAIEDFLLEACVGELSLLLCNEDSMIADGLPTDRFPEGQLVFGLFRDIPWVLDEPCQLPSRDQFFEAQESRWRTEMQDTLQSLLLATGQPFAPVELTEAEALKSRCIERYVQPADLHMARQICYTSEENGRGFLWHMMSYKLVPSVDGDDACAQYEQLCATDYYVFVEHEGHCIHVQGSRLPALDAIERLPDTYVISGALDWIYAHTHEDGWYGPYLAISAGS